MTPMTCPQCVGIEAQFNDKVARRELKRFRKSGPKKSTRVLLKRLRSFGIAGRTLLDVGGGVGAIQHVCAEEGVKTIVSVDAAPAYTAAARSEAQRRGYAHRATYLEGDFIDLAGEVPPSDFVTMDRVLCCYHDMPGLLRPAAQRATTCLGLVFPRESWWIRGGARLVNFLLGLFRSKFRAYVHPHSTIEACAVESGLTLRFSDFSGIWRVVVYERLSS